MSGTRDLLVELGTEELPPTALRGLRDAFHQHLMQSIDKAGLAFSGHRAYATPRRLAVLVEGLQERQADETVERRGPALQTAYDGEGKLTKAAEGFARSCGVDPGELDVLRTDKGDWMVYRGVRAGRSVTELLPEMVEQALNRLPIPKRMRWGAGQASFVRPVHWLVLLFGDEVIPARILGIESGRLTRGHRFHAPEPITLDSPADYARVLEAQGHVIVDFERRREMVRRQAEATADALNGKAIIDEDLLDEVTALVEWPVAISGTFEERFLDVPPEALISSMQGHQKYFPVEDSLGRLMPRFITIANLESKDPREVAKGNERVIRPRLADAAFFWEQDRKRPLSERVQGLKDIIFQRRLGTLHDQALRVAALARLLAEEFQVAPSAAEQAAMLGRCDLLTEMVGEFPELQGVMGRYYAMHDGLKEGIPEALDEQYSPRFAGDTIARSALGQLLAVASRADVLTGIFAIGQAPTGDKDPFALRRAALGLIRTLIEGERSLSLRALLDAAATHQPDDVKAMARVDEVFAFCMERLRGYYHEQGYPAELFEAVRSTVVADADGDLQPVDNPVDFDRRLRAVADFRKLEDASSLAAANKRVINILRKAEYQGEAGLPQPALFTSEEERRLYEIVQPLREEVRKLVGAGDYKTALRQLARARGPVDAFFEQVMVMAEDPKVRANRLSLLRQLAELFSSVADISRLSPA
ncbi:MAG: glycine--tRNA ligase subunit beta [Ectothiorhodospiraceae bacterium]|nr:glycine--tRNA ligase subunit beta [Ectothiorhodospiraceae bacterium]